MDLGWFSQIINASSTRVGFQIDVGTATINAKGDRVFGEKLVEQLSILPIGTWQP
jgi:hypothetical protein